MMIENELFKDFVLDKEQSQLLEEVLILIDKILDYPFREQSLKILCENLSVIKQDLYMIVANKGISQAYLDVLSRLVTALSENLLHKLSIELTKKDNRFEDIRKLKESCLEFLYYLEYDQDYVERFGRSNSIDRKYIGAVYEKARKNETMERKTKPNDITLEEKTRRQKEIQQCYGTKKEEK